MRRKDRQISEVSDLELIISRCDVCRVAFADGNVPYIVTMNFGYSGGDHPCFYFHCANEGRKLDQISKNNYVCFELDTDHEIYRGENGCDWGMKYSSVVGYGNISVIMEQAERRSGMNSIMSHYSDRKEFSFDDTILSNTTILRLENKRDDRKTKITVGLIQILIFIRPFLKIIINTIT